MGVVQGQHTSVWSSPDGNLVVDESAFDALFRAYFDPLRWYVYRYVRSWEEAEDLVHDLFVRTWERRAELGAVDDLKNYLYTAARNRALAHLRHRHVEERWQRREQTIIDVNRTPVPDDPERDVHSAEIRGAVQRALDDLAPRQKDVVLRRWRGESYDDIATALDVSVSTVSVHMTRALERLRGALERFFK